MTTDLIKRLEIIEGLAKEAADELATLADQQNQFRDAYPSIMANYRQDIDLPNRIYAALKAKDQS